MRFVASLTRGASELEMMFRLWRESGDERNPFENVLITPLFIPKSGLRVIRDWKEQGVIKNLYFDSGGYYVQMGRIDFVELYMELLLCYGQESWADHYVLPDHVPSSSDSLDVKWRKVRDTAEYSRAFFDEMPDDLKLRSIPVVHGHNHDQISYCIENHLSLGTDYLGFGSFDTGGIHGSVNKLSSTTYSYLGHITRILAERNIRLHGFGVGTPPVIHLLSEIDVYSFDSIGWMKTAGFGKVFLPFVRAYNITYRDKSATTITENEFAEMKAYTGHECSFCTSFERLHRDRFSRIMHNLAVVMDMVHGLHKDLDVLDVLRRYSPNYAALAKG